MIAGKMTPEEFATQVCEKTASAFQQMNASRTLDRSLSLKRGGGWSGPQEAT